jgi:hypothetical protein
MPVLGGSQALGTTNDPWLGYEAKKYRWPRWQAPRPKCPKHGKMTKTLEKIPIFGAMTTPWHGTKAKRAVWRCRHCHYVVASDSEVVFSRAERKHKSLKRYVEVE